MHNPYTAPESAHSENPPARARRPVSVWLFLMCCAVMGGLLVFGIGRLLWWFATDTVAVRDYLRWAYVVVTRMAMLAAIAGALYVVLYRRWWGRWLGVIAMVAFAGLSIFGQDHGSYASEAERMNMAIFRRGVVPLLMALWCYSFGFSAKSKRYFETRLGRR